LLDVPHRTLGGEHRIGGRRWNGARRPRNAENRGRAEGENADGDTDSKRDATQQGISCDETWERAWISATPSSLRAASWPEWRLWVYRWQSRRPSVASWQP